MAGINGFRNVNLGGVNQTGAAKGTQQAKLETESLIQKNDQLDGFVKSNNAEQTREEDKPKFDEGGDGKKKGWKEKLGKFFENYGNALARNGAVDPGNLKTWDKSVGQAIASSTLGYDPFG